MKAETKAKWETRKYKFKMWAAEWIPPLAIGLGGGMLVGGYFGAIKNSSDINKMKKRIDHQSEVLDQHADAGNALVDRCREDHEKLEELERRQALLMEQALRETAGSVK